MPDEVRSPTREVQTVSITPVERETGAPRSRWAWNARLQWPEQGCSCPPRAGAVKPSEF